MAMATQATNDTQSSHRGPPQSLKISPNLNLLAEHDERMRQLSASLASPGSSSFPTPSSPTGLPPPPRGPRRKPRSPSSPGVFHTQSDSVPSSPSYLPETNPYLNDAPKIENILSLSPKLALQKLPTNGSGESSSDGGKVMSSDRQNREFASGQPPVVVPRRFNTSSPPATSAKRRSKLTKDRPSAVRNTSPSTTPNNTLPRRSRLPSHASTTTSSSRSSFSFIPSHSPTQSLRSTEAMSRVQNRSPQSSLDHKRRRSSESRNSFIDLSPPDSDEPSPSPSSSSSRRRKQETSPPVRHSMDNGEPPKPPLPTTPKPDFSYLHRAEKDNQRSSSERAELVERSRKLAKIFGETPGAADVARTDPSKRSLDAGSRHSESTRRVSGDKSRRHSTPLTPDTSSFDLAASKDLSSQSVKSRASEPSSPTSFMNLSEDEDSPTTPKKRRAPRSSSLTPSALESLGPEERAEEERKIKRDRLAKLHRFLGSRVPTNLVLGTDPLASLPSPAPHSGSLSDEMTPTDESSRKAWIRRRRRSSIAAFPSDYTERVKEDLDEKEKAINVRRAQKMEKVFGVAPPQTLFHTRHAPVTSIQIPASQASVTRSWSDSLPSPTRNQNQSSYSKKSRRTDSRPGTSDSTEGLIPKNFGEGASRPRRGSVVYNHYQHSLNSLNDIIDRDDVQSLASLRQYLETDATDPPSSEARLADEISLVSSKRSSTLSSRSERRRSMPPVSPSARNSYMSFGYNDLSPDVDSFQARRRKATKLTQFFGVDYTEVIQDVLESLEAGVEHDQKRGTLNAEEVEDLRRALRNLKSKRTKAL